MSDLRHDFLDDRWVLCVPERGQRPHDRRHGVAREPAPAHDPDCPFCPGNEAALLGILAERPGVAGTAWATRVVPNRFPILRPASGAPAPGAAVHGVHEVVIETPRHDRQLADLSPDELVAVAHTYHARARVHAGQARGSSSSATTAPALAPPSGTRTRTSSRPTPCRPRRRCARSGRGGTSPGTGAATCAR